MLRFGALRTRWRWRPILIALRIAVGVCAGLAFVYLVGMNAFLQTRWFRNAIGFSPEEFRVEYTRAYSILPGRIHVEGLSIRGSDTSVQWILALDSCDFRVQFQDLLHRKFHADHVRGSGLSMRIRLRLEQEEATPEVVAAVPPVPGFSDPPYLLLGPPRPPLTDANYNLWTIQLDDVVAEHVRELWIQTLRYEGDMRVRGRWLFRPVRWLEVGPATVDVDTLEVSYGPASPLFTGLHGTLEATVHPFDVRKPQGLEVLGYVSTQASLRGLAEPAELLARLAPTSRWRLAPSESPLDLQVTVDHGTLQPGSHASVSSARSELLGADVSLRAAVAADLRVETESEGSVAHVDVGLKDLRIRRHDLELGSVASVALRLESQDVDLTHPSIDSATFAVEVNGAVAPTVAFLSPWLPTELALDSGAARGDGHLEGSVQGETASGQLEFTIRDLSLARGSDRLGANARGVLKLESGSLRDGDIDLTDSRVALDGVVANVGKLVVTAPVLSAHTPHLHFGPDGRAGTVSVELPAAECRDLRPLAGRLKLPEAITIVQGNATASLQMVADASLLSAHGDASLVAHGLRVKVGSDTYQGELRVALHASNLDGDRRTTGFSGSTVAFTSGGPASADAWWARVSLSDAQLRLAGGARVRANLHVTAENASPVQALLARVTPVPRWVLDAFPTDGLRVDGEIRETPTSLEVRSIVARSSGTSVRLEYAKHDADKEGMALVSSGSLRLGFNLAGAGQSFLLFGAENWFERRVADLRARERLADESVSSSTQ